MLYNDRRAKEIVKQFLEAHGSTVKELAKLCAADFVVRDSLGDKFYVAVTEQTAHLLSRYNIPCYGISKAELAQLSKYDNVEINVVDFEYGRVYCENFSELNEPAKYHDIPFPFAVDDIVFFARDRFNTWFPADLQIYSNERIAKNDALKKLAVKIAASCNASPVHYTDELPIFLSGVFDFYTHDAMYVVQAQVAETNDADGTLCYHIDGGLLTFLQNFSKTTNAKIDLIFVDIADDTGQVYCYHLPTETVTEEKFYIRKNTFHSATKIIDRDLTELRKLYR